MPSDLATNGAAAARRTGAFATPRPTKPWAGVDVAIMTATNPTAPVREKILGKLLGKILGPKVAVARGADSPI